MNKIKTYLQDVYNELMHKVSWPKWSELQTSAVVTMVATLIIAIVVFLMDATFRNVMKFVYDLIY